MAYNVERHSADVLVVGGGIAGALAAIQAREDGAEVILLERANTHRSGAAGSGVDHLFSYVPPVHERVGYTKDDMKEDIAGEWMYQAGLGDRRISDHFVDVSYERITSLEKYGVKLRFEDAHLPGGFRLMPQFHSIPTSINFEGRDIKPKLTKAMISAGVHIINHAAAVDILNDEDGSAAGAVAVSSREDKVIVVKAKAVIISTSGGAGRLTYNVNLDDRYFENPTGSGSGFGITLPLRAGAEIANLEFSIGEGELAFHGFSTRVGSPGSSWWPAARAVDDDGTVVVKRIYDLHIDEPDYKEKNTKMYAEFMDEFRSMHGQLAKGRQLYMDFEEATEKEVEYIKWSLSNEGRSWLYVQNLNKNHIDLKKVKVPYVYARKVSLHGPGSGVIVNWKCETTVPGLYAAGDTMGVTGGSAPVAVVTGYEAGLQAAAYAKQQSGEKAVSEEKVEKVLAVLEEIRGNETGEPWQNIGNAARQIVNTFAVYPLTDERIKNALQLIRKLKKNTNLYAKDAHEAARSFEVLSLIDAAEAIFVAAQHRTEPFGPYLRVRKYADAEKLDQSQLPADTQVYGLYIDSSGEFQFNTHDYRNREREAQV